MEDFVTLAKDTIDDQILKAEIQTQTTVVKFSLKRINK